MNIGISGDHDHFFAVFDFIIIVVRLLVVFSDGMPTCGVFIMFYPIICIFGSPFFVSLLLIFWVL